MSVNQWVPLERGGLRIRKQQSTFLDQHQAASYELRLTKFLQEQLPDAAEEATDKLRSETAAQIDKARGYGLRSEQEVANYVITAWLLGAEFDTEFPAATEVLTAQIPCEAKSQFLEEWTKQLFEEFEGAD